eukprot:Nitzschia sp. Nitz4//scaffold71_size96697//80402//80782//NITZ4_004708-RA/size96697-processed-gene-0.136-mRNA-1//-1//CDS//3329557286//6926//frame0
MSVEGELSRLLDIRFIDARELTTLAKIELGIHGYPCAEGQEIIRQRALEIFESRSKEDKRKLRRMHSELETVKSMHSSSQATEENTDTGSVTSFQADPVEIVPVPTVMVSPTQKMKQRFRRAISFS